MKREKSKLLKIIVLIITIIVAVILGYYIGIDENNYENDINNKVKETNIKKTEPSSMTFARSRIEVKEVFDKNGNTYDEVYVDGKKLDLKLNEEILQFVGISDIEVIDDIALFNIGMLDVSYLYVLDIDGDILNRFVSKAVRDVNGIKLTGEMYRGEYKIEDNKIYIETDDLGQDPSYMACASEPNEIVRYKDVYEYKNKELTYVNTINGNTAEEEIKEKNINCSFMAN